MDYFKYIYNHCYQFKWITLFVSLPTQVFARMKSQSQRSLSRIKTSRNTSHKVWFTCCLILSQNTSVWFTCCFNFITKHINLEIFHNYYAGNIYLLKPSNRNIRKRCEICLKLIICSKLLMSFWCSLVNFDMFHTFS